MNKYLEKIAEHEQKSFGQVAVDRATNPFGWISRGQKSLIRGPRGLALAKLEKLVLSEGDKMYYHQEKATTHNTVTHYK